MIRVGVIRGGIGSQYDLSLDTGGHVISHLRDGILKDKYKVVDMLVDKDGILHINGLPKSLSDVHHNMDVVFNALHGEHGEDGKIQNIFEQWNIPYTGSRAFPSALGYNRKLTWERFENLGLKMPKRILFPVYQPDFDGPEEDYPTKKAQEVWRTMPAPWIVKPFTKDTSMGIHVCKTFPELVRAFEVGMRQNVSIVVEEMIEGKEARVFAIDKFRNKDVYTLPAVEIRNKDICVCPGNFSNSEKKILEETACKIHEEFNLDHYSASNFIVHPKKGLYVLSVNTLPELHAQSHIASALSAVGASFAEFIDHILKLAINKK